MSERRLTDEELERLFGSYQDAGTLITLALAELRELRALLATPMPCGWPEPAPASPAKPTMVMWDAVDAKGGNALDADEAIALGASLIRAALKASGKEQP